MAPPVLAPQRRQPEDADGCQGEHERKDVREVAQSEQEVDLHREAETGPLAMPPPEAKYEEQQRQADREVVEAVLEELVIGEGKGEEREPALLRPHGAGEIPGAAEEEQHVGGNQQLFG